MGSTLITLLGRFGVSIDGRDIEIKSSKERALLARLALEPGTVVSTDSLIEAIWPEGDHPDDPARALRYHVWHLRELLEPDRADRSEGTLVLTRPPGHVLAIATDAVDAVRLETDWDRARALEGDPRRRREALGLLLDAWRPACFADASAHGPLADAAVRLDRLRSTVLADRIAVDIALGRDAELVPELEQLVTAHPFDERLRGQLMVALYRSGRQADALAVYTATRAVLVDELGVEPGPELRDLEQRILRHDPEIGGQPPFAVAQRVNGGERQTNLPHAVDSFVGREAELDELHRLFGEHRLVTLTGAGGTGKTRLAVEASRPLIDGYTGGVWLAELAPVTDEALVPTAVAEVWRLAASGSDVDDVVIAFLCQRQLLLVLDNCEHVHAAAGRFVARVLREAPEVKILATSRESLGVAGEAVMRVPSLARHGSGGTPGAAATLFVDRGRAARPAWTPGDADDAAIDRICAHLDGIPLGLELAAARLRSMDPAEIADHLERSLGLLAAAKTAVPRHRTLAATVEWSYRLLSEAEQLMFRRASVFVGGFDLAAAVAVCSEPGAGLDNVVDLVDSLVDKSLFLATPGIDGTRYRLLEPVRQWAHEQLAPAGDLDGVQLAHAHHFARFIAELSPAYHRREQEAALRRTVADYPNVRLALATLADAGDVDRHLEISFGLFSFWAHQSMHLEGFRTCQRSLGLATSGTDLMRQVKTAFVGSVCGAWTGRAEVVEFAKHGRGLAERLGDERAIAWSELALAVLYGNDGPPRGAGVSVPDPLTAGHMQCAVDLWAANPGAAWWDPMWERGVQQLCSSIFLPYGPERLAEFRASRDAFESTGDRGWLAILDAQALDLLEFAGPEETRRVLEEGVSLAISPTWSNTSLYRLGVLNQLLGDHHEAIENLTATIEFEMKSSDRDWTTEGRYLAISRCELGHRVEARRLLEAVFATLDAEWNEREAQRTLAVAALVLESAGNRQLAGRAIGRADPFQDNFVDTIGKVRARLTDVLGASATDALVAEGAASVVAALVTEVRAALAVLPTDRLQ